MVLLDLEASGAKPEPEVGEGAEVYLNRMGTSLMALYRDDAESEAFNALYALTRDSVFAWVKSLLSRNSPALDPNELLQDTFVNVYRYPRSFRDDHAGSFRVWVRTIAGNLVRRAGTRRARYSFHALPEGLQEPADVSSNPAHLAAAVDEGRILLESWKLFLLLYARAWEELSDRDRQTLHLVEVEGLSYEDAGKILGVGRSNMKMIVFRSRNRIARRISRAMAAGRLSALGLEVA
ncbi:MAG: RNA polymerase sigma factor (sigma-70 family) [Planctomycetota bacterium]|jgi:RNA polymerase sigma factor (sigma-70 family)